MDLSEDKKICVIVCDIELLIDCLEHRPGEHCGGVQAADAKQCKGHGKIVVALEAFDWLTLHRHQPVHEASEHGEIFEHGDIGTVT